MRRISGKRYSRVSPRMAAIGITAGWHSQRFTCSTVVRVFSSHENRLLTANRNIPTQRCGAVGFPYVHAREDVNLGAFAQPQVIYSLVTSVWNDPEFFVTFGASPQLALLLTGGIGLFTSCCLYLLHRVLPLVERIVQVVQRILSSETINGV